MSVYQLRTFADIVNAVCEEVKIQSGDTTTRNRIKRDINMIYLNEVAAYEQWSWLRGFANLTFDGKTTAGTAAVTQHSRTVTLTIAPATSMVGAWFSTEGYSERYTVAEHTANSTTLTLDSIYTGSSGTAQSYQLWRDKQALPADCRETFEVTHDFHSEPVVGVGLQKFRQFSNPLPKAEGYPQYYTTSDFNDPTQYGAITSLPATATRASSGLLKTIVFASDVSSYLKDGDEVKISGCSVDSYNGKVKIASVSTTTISYTVTVVYNEAVTADTAITVQKLQNENASRRYRELVVYPSVNTNKVTLHVDYIKILDPLENDDDEPLMPLEDRVVLFYGAASRAWSRARNPEEAQRNGNMYDRKLSKMSGKLDDSTDQPVLRPSRVYIGVKRRGQRYRTNSDFAPGIVPGGSGSSSPVIGTANSAAIFNNSGELTASPTITTTELNRLDGITSTAVGISDAQTLTNKSISGSANTLTNIPNSATTATSTNTLSTIVARDSSGNFSAGTITAALTGNATTATTATSAATLSATLIPSKGGTGVANNDASTLTISGSFGTTLTVTALTALTLPTTGTLATRAGTETLTNKTIDGGSNTLTNVARSSIATGTNNHVVINSGAGALSSEANLAISRGGTGAGTKAAGFDALSPMTTAGDIVYGGAAGTGTRLAVGAANTVLRSDGTNPSWVSPSLLSAKSADYTVTTTDNIATIIMTTAGTNRTVTLPAASSCTNRIITIKKIDTGTGKCTIDANASETIDGALTYDLLYQNEAITIQCDGTSWYLVDYQPSKWLAFTAVYVNSNSNLATSGARLRKDGKKMELAISSTWTGAGLAASFQLTPPVAAGASAGNVACGYGTFERAGATAERPFSARFSSGSIFFFEAGSSTPIQGNAFANTDVVHMYFAYEVD